LTIALAEFDLIKVLKEKMKVYHVNELSLQIFRVGGLSLSLSIVKSIQKKKRKEKKRGWYSTGTTIIISFIIYEKAI